MTKDGPRLRDAGFGHLNLAQYDLTRGGQIPDIGLGPCPFDLVEARVIRRSYLKIDYRFDDRGSLVAVTAFDK
jgi:hypothetical protein